MKTVQLGDIFEFRNGRSFKKSEWKTRGLPIIRIQNLNDKAAAFNYFDGDHEEKIEVNKGDLLFSWSGTVGTSFGPHVWDRERGVLNQHIFKLKKKVDIEDKYAYYALKEITAEIEKQAHGAGGLVHITKEKLNKFTIPLPLPSEQRRIVARLDAAFEKIDRAIELTQENIFNTQSLYQNFFSAQLSGAAGYDCTLNDVCSIESKLVDPRQAAYRDRLHIGGANIESDTGNLVKLKTAEQEKLISAKFPFDENTVLYSKIRPYLKKVVRPSFSGLCSADIYPLSTNPQLSKDYLYYLLLTNDFTQYAIAGSGRAGMPKVNRPHLFAYKFILPSISDQNEIVKKLDAMSIKTEGLVRKYKKKVSLLHSLKQSLLTQAFSQGKVQ